MTEVSAADIRRAAMDLLARREHSNNELSSKLTRRFGERLTNPDLLSEQLERLREEGLQSDQRYAASMTRQLIGSGKGPRRVEYELKIKGCDPDTAIAEAYPEGVDWSELARDVYVRKFDSKPLGGDWKEMQRERAKRARFMAQRGFEPSHFVSLLQGSQEQAELD